MRLAILSKILRVCGNTVAQHLPALQASVRIKMKRFVNHVFACLRAAHTRPAVNICVDAALRAGRFSLQFGPLEAARSSALWLSPVPPSVRYSTIVCAAARRTSAQEVHSEGGIDVRCMKCALTEHALWLLRAQFLASGGGRNAVDLGDAD